MLICGSTSAIFVTATREPNYTRVNAISLHRSLPWGRRLSPICNLFRAYFLALNVGDATGLLEHLTSLFYEQRDILFGGSIARLSLPGAEGPRSLTPSLSASGRCELDA